MKCACILLLVILLCSYTPYQYSYQQTIQDHATSWSQTYNSTIKNPQHIQTLIDIILLSYQLAQQSCHMIIAKLTAQEELMKIYTPSLIDSWQTNMQVMANNTAKLDAALTRIKECQQKFKLLFDQLKMVGSRLIQVNPQPTQTIIADLKICLFAWTKEQELDNLINVFHQEFQSTIIAITDMKNLFSITMNNPEPKQSDLKDAVGYISKSYKDIETVFDHFTKLRKESMYRISDFFYLFFKTYYTNIYNALDLQERSMLKTMASDSQFLPSPDDFFTKIAYTF